MERNPFHTPHRAAVLRLALGLALLGLATPARADDVKVQPAPGSGFVVTDKTGATERFKVLENGQVIVPGLLAAPQVENQPLCYNTATGRLGSCSAVPPGTGLTDNGDGTVTDHATGLTWEKKTGVVGMPNPSDVHDVNNRYTWSATGTAADGTAFTDFLARVNGQLCASSSCPGLGGHSDWRVPTLSELQTIVDATQGQCSGGSGPCINPIFVPTVPGYDWSASANAGNPGSVWTVDFSNGASFNGGKANGSYVRAVRGGL